MLYRGKEEYRDKKRDNYRRRDQSETMRAILECWICEVLDHYLDDCLEIKCFLYYKKKYIAQLCLEKSINLASMDEKKLTINYVKGSPQRMSKSLLTPWLKYNFI